jgi:hypothetical protein
MRSAGFGSFPNRTRLLPAFFAGCPGAADRANLAESALFDRGVGFFVI